MNPFIGGVTRVMLEGAEVTTFTSETLTNGKRPCIGGVTRAMSEGAEVTTFTSETLTNGKRPCIAKRPTSGIQRRLARPMGKTHAS